LSLTLSNKTESYTRQQKVLDHIATKLNMTVITVTFDSSYPTGGESLTYATVGHGFKSIVAVFPQASTNGYVGVYDLSTNKLKVMQTNSDYAGDTPLIEVENTADLSTVSMDILVIGY
jgi:hypothetical protein